MSLSVGTKNIHMCVHMRGGPKLMFGASLWISTHFLELCFLLV